MSTSTTGSGKRYKRAASKFSLQESAGATSTRVANLQNKSVPTMQVQGVPVDTSYASNLDSSLQSPGANPPQSNQRGDLSPQRRALSLPSTGHSRRPSEIVLDKIEQMTHLLNEDAVPHQSARGKVIALIRLTNLIVLMSMVALVGTGTTWYKSFDQKSKTVHIAVETWSQFPTEHIKDMLGPNATQQKLEQLQKQNNIMIHKQWLPFILNVVLMIETLTLLVMRIMDKPVGRILVGFYAFTAVPVELLTFAVEMYYCRCPWVQSSLANYYKISPAVTGWNGRGSMNMETSNEPASDCVVYAWAAASALSLVSAALFIADGIAACFETQRNPEEHLYHMAPNEDVTHKNIPDYSQL